MEYVHSTALGISSGAIEVSLLQPLLYWKNAIQQGIPLTLNPAILYRGLGMSILNMSVNTGLQFPLTAAATSLITGGQSRRLTSSEMILSGCLGGLVSGFACSPMELVMIQQQRHGGTLVNTARTIVSTGGSQLLFRGLLMTCGREGVFTAGYLGVAPALSRELAEEYEYGEAQAKIISAVAGGVLAGTLSHPMDTIKTCMQGDIEGKVYRGLRHTASIVYREGRMYKGWAWRTSRMICSVFIFNECRLRLSPLLSPWLCN